MSEATETEESLKSSSAEAESYTHPTLQADPDAELAVMELADQRVEYAPKEDITTYELAQCIPVLLSMMQGGIPEIKSQIAVLPDEAARHFEVE